MGDAGVQPVRRALLAVYDKTGVVEVARALVELGATLVSSGGTAQVLIDAGIPVTPVEEVTGVPEMLGGRVKTLHPRIHGGHARRPAQARARGRSSPSTASSRSTWWSCNLYPFRETVAGGASFDDVIETDRHRRACDGARRGEELRVGGGRDRSGRIRRGRRRAATARAGSPAGPGERSPRPRSRTRRPTTPPSPPGSPIAGATEPLPEYVGARPREGRPTSATARTRTSEAACTRHGAVRGCSAAPRCCRARRCRSTTGWTRCGAPSWRRRSPRAPR